MSHLEADEPAVTQLRRRLAEDLRVAMKQRDAAATSAIRCLLARLDNASAVQQTRDHVPVFGESGDVPRRFLSLREAQVLLTEEADLRRQAAQQYAQLDKVADSRRVRSEYEVMTRYIHMPES